MISSKLKKKFINNIAIFGFITITFLLIYKYYNKNIENFDLKKLVNYKDTSCLNNIINDKNITVLGGGTSIQNFKKTNDTVIVANNTITHDIIPSFNKIIWVVGGIGKKVIFDQYSKNTLHKLKKTPNIIVVLMFKNNQKHNEIFGKFSNYLTKKYPKIILSNYFIDKSMNTRLSTGYYSIKMPLKYNPKNIIIAGLDSINGSNQYDKKTFLKQTFDKEKIVGHLECDKKFIKYLDDKTKKKLKPIKECGLHEFLNQNIEYFGFNGDILESSLNNIIKNKNITVLGSGKSIQNFKKTNDTVIVANNTITHDIIPSFNKIIWVIGGINTKETFDQYSKNTLHKLKKTPDIIIVLMKNKKIHNERFDKFSNYLIKTYPKIILSNYFVDLKNQLSTGYYSIKLPLKYNPKNIIIAGLDSINGSNQYDKTFYNLSMNQKKKYDKTKFMNLHNSVDIKFIKNLDDISKNKLKPIKECGLYEFLNK